MALLTAPPFFPRRFRSRFVLDSFPIPFPFRSCFAPVLCRPQPPFPPREDDIQPLVCKNAGFRATPRNRYSTAGVHRGAPVLPGVAYFPARKAAIPRTLRSTRRAEGRPSACTSLPRPHTGHRHSPHARASKATQSPTIRPPSGAPGCAKNRQQTPERAGS